MPRVPARVQADTDAWRSRVNLIFAFGTRYLAGAGVPPSRRHVG